MTLLRREPINLDTPEIRQFIAGKRVLVTGGGGSIGSEVCRQAAKYGATCIIPFGRTEGNLFEIDRELRAKYQRFGTSIGTTDFGKSIDIACPVIGDICDAARVRQVLSEHKPDIIFHCAAHKHVPLMEKHPCEAIKNNVFGTKTMADAALAAGVGAFVMVSTDKAVNPASAMGASKRCAELYVQWLGQPGIMQIAGRRDGIGTYNAKISRTRFMTVRFGNVLGSSGSVVPIFQRQIDGGGPVTVTHPEMERYFMTIPEAAQLVMHAGAIGGGGEIFVLDMGQPVRIVDLARDMIAQSGKDIRIEFTGVRPGEKLHEELSYTRDQTLPTSHPKIMVWKTQPPTEDRINAMLTALNVAAEVGRPEDSRAALKACVPEYVV